MNVHNPLMPAKRPGLFNGMFIGSWNSIYYNYLYCALESDWGLGRPPGIRVPHVKEGRSKLHCIRRKLFKGGVCMYATQLCTSASRTHVFFGSLVLQSLKYCFCVQLIWDRGSPPFPPHLWENSPILIPR